MSKLEIFLVCLSLIETAISVFIWHKHTKAKARYEAIEAQYRVAVEGIEQVWRNAS